MKINDNKDKWYQNIKEILIIFFIISELNHNK